MTPERIRELLDVALEGRSALENIDVGHHTETVTVAWQCLDELYVALWDAYTTPPAPHSGRSAATPFPSCSVNERKRYAG